MRRVPIVILSLAVAMFAASLFSAKLFAANPPSKNLPSKKYLNQAAIRPMVAAAEAKAKELNLNVSICVVDESGTLLFLEKGDGVSVVTLQFAQKKARHAAFYGKPSKDAVDTVKGGNVAAMAFPDYFPSQGGVPIQLDGQTLGGIGVSGAPSSEIDQAVAQAGLDAFLKD